MKNTMKKPLSFALGTTVIAALSASPVALADTAANANPFGMQNLESGYMQLAEGKCGEAKCGGKAKTEEAKCGEGKCGEGMMNKSSSAKEAKCGEGKCGGK